MVIFMNNPLTVSGSSGSSVPPGEGVDFPVGGIMLWYGSSTELATSSSGSYIICDGTSDTPDLRGKMVRGATLASQLLTTGGALTHIHAGGTVGTTGDHNHSYDAFSLGNASTYTTAVTGTTNRANLAHAHNISAGNSSSDGDHNHSWGGSSGATSSLPPIKKLHWIKKISLDPDGNSYLGQIIGWSEATLPENWALCNGVASGSLVTVPDLREFFIYTASTDSDVGDSGGSSSHSHTNPASSSNGAAHTHAKASSSLGSASGTNVAGAGSANPSSTNHTHALSQSTNSGGSAHTHTNSLVSTTSLPPYSYLYFIIRVA